MILNPSTLVSKRWIDSALIGLPVALITNRIGLFVAINVEIGTVTSTFVEVPLSLNTSSEEEPELRRVIL